MPAFFQGGPNILARGAQYFGRGRLPPPSGYVTVGDITNYNKIEYFLFWSLIKAFSIVGNLIFQKNLFLITVFKMSRFLADLIQNRL